MGSSGFTEGWPYRSIRVALIFHSSAAWPGVPVQQDRTFFVSSSNASSIDLVRSLQMANSSTLSVAAMAPFACRV